jgi:O-antigen/teichoic acid export membrane protein
VTLEAWFRESVTADQLASRSLRSGATAVGARIAQLVLQLGAVVVLARLLTPADFGIQAMVLPIAFLLNGITHQALQSAVMQQDTLEAVDANGFFFAALPFNLALTGAMALAGQLLAWLYDEPRVVWVAVAWAAVIFLVTLTSVQEALLKRQHRFATVARAQLVAHALSVAAAIAAARAGAGYWALMLQIAVMELGRAAAIWRVVAWRPARTLTGQTRRGAAMKHYWLGVIGARAVSWIGDQSDRVVVGAIGSASVAGLYDGAKRWAWLPFFELFIPLTDVAVTSLSRVQQDVQRYRAYVRYALMSVFAFVLPIAAFVFLEAPRILSVILGSQWLGAAPFMRWLSIALVGASMVRLMQWIYLSTGMTRRQMHWSFVTTPVILSGVLIGGLTNGPIGVAASLAFSTWLLAIPSARNAIRGTPLTLGDCLVVVLRPLAAAAASAAVLSALNGYLPASPGIIALLLRGIVFVATYVVAWLLLPGGRRALGEWRQVAQRALGCLCAARAPMPR